jgi:hypothetical protein
MTIEHFSPAKKTLQRLGSWVVRQASQTDIPDTTSGFRAYNREAALGLLVVSNFTYTLESLIQAGKMLVAVEHVPVAANEVARGSRLFDSTSSYVRRNGLAVFRAWVQYEPLRFFLVLAALFALGAAAAWTPFVLDFVRTGDTGGHVQSLILGAVLTLIAVQMVALGVIGDVLAGQRVIMQRVFERVRRLELDAGVSPSHYEAGQAEASTRPPVRVERLEQTAAGTR